MSSITALTLVPNAGDRLQRCLESVGGLDDGAKSFDNITQGGVRAVCGGAFHGN